MYDARDAEADVWNAYGEERVIEGLVPGPYYLVVGDNESDRTKIDVKDTAQMQRSETYIWTLWDTILAIASVVLFAIVVFMIIRLIRYRRKKKANAQQKDSIEKE